MSPFLGAGANQAIQDGHALGLALSRIGTKHENTAEAVSAYERARRGPTEAILRGSLALGFLETQSGPVGVTVRNTMFKMAGLLGLSARSLVLSAVPRLE